MNVRLRKTVKVGFKVDVATCCLHAQDAYVKRGQEPAILLGQHQNARLRGMKKHDVVMRLPRCGFCAQLRTNSSQLEILCNLSIIYALCMLCALLSC